MDIIGDILRGTRTIATVGMSTDENKSAHAIPASLLERGFDVIPVHPEAGEILGRTAYRRVEDIPQQVDVVQVFRPSHEAADVARSAVAAGATTLWLQAGISSPEARAIAEEAGLRYVENYCLGKEAARRNFTVAA